MDDFFELGPMPGYRCPSTRCSRTCSGASAGDFVFITSANVSSGLTGRVEAAHYDLGGVQEDFGDRDGIVLIGHRDEAAVRASYPLHVPMSTSILAFHKLAVDDDGRPAIVLDRHGSLDVKPMREIVERHGLALVLGEGARERLPARDVALAQ